MLVLAGSDAFMEGNQNRRLVFRLREDGGPGHNLEGADVALLCYLGADDPMELPCSVKNAREGTFETQEPVDARQIPLSSFKAMARVDRYGRNRRETGDKPISTEFSSALTVWVEGKA